MVHSGPPCAAEVNSIPPHRNALLAKQPELHLTERCGPVRANNTLPWRALRCRRENEANETRSRAVDIAVGTHEALRDGSNAREDDPSSLIIGARPRHRSASIAAMANREGCPQPMQNG